MGPLAFQEAFLEINLDKEVISVPWRDQTLERDKGNLHTETIGNHRKMLI